MRKLSIFSLTLITVCSVDSIRNLPAAALAGSQLILYFALALILFLLPCAIVACWFSTQSNQGIYGWVKQGLGKPAGYLAIWFQCAQNVILYPSFLCFIAGVCLYNFSPKLAENKVLIFSLVVIFIWGLTWINLKGVQLSSRFNAFCSITGILIPFSSVLLIGLYWWITEIPTGANALPPAEPYSWTSLSAIILSFCGIELAGVHAQDSKPGAFSISIMISVIIIFFTMLFGSITIAMIIPIHQLNFLTSIPQLIYLFFEKIHCGQVASIINGLVAIGCLGGANNWLIVPIKGLNFAAQEGFIADKHIRVNKNNVPSRLLIYQSILVTVISFLFLIIPALNASYWIMLSFATQMMLLMYLLLFFSALKVSSRESNRYRKIITIPASLGILGVCSSLIVTLNPPPSLNFHSQTVYAGVTVCVLILMVLIPVWSVYRKNRVMMI